jgi:NAD(P)-dependent dehydrogenase (short-subunit alcohol dehydrogenase family)
VPITFDNRVAIVTGAGGGIGRSHALALATRGARVVVNDLGGDVHGAGGDPGAALAVVEEIERLGGEALADGANVAEPDEVEAMVEKAMSRWGRVDILVNNAGILRDRSFANMTIEEFDTVVAVHLRGAFLCTKAVWDIMKERSYGRVVFTTSSSGLYGNFGQANYSAAKLGVVGLMHTLHLEGARYDIRVNALAPAAGTRMTDGLVPDDAFRLLRPEAVSTGLVWLVSDDGPSRVILSAGAGCFARAAIVETEGFHLEAEGLTPESLADLSAELDDLADARELAAGFEQTTKFVARATGTHQEH